MHCVLQILVTFPVVTIPFPMTHRSRFLPIIVGVLVLFALAWPASASRAAERAPSERIALIVGNSAYARLPLRNPVNDARAVAQALRDLGFDVIQRENAGYAGMIDAMRDFLDRSATSRVRVIYFAGHGAQYRGRNFLIPVDALLRSEEDLAHRAANASDLVDKLAQFKAGVNIVILDACRDAAYPLLAKTRNPNIARTVQPGFAESTRAPQGTLIAFSTAPGSVALDGPGNHSAYTRHLLSQINEPGLPIENLFKRVRDGVARDTAHKQVPWESSSLVGDFCFRLPADGACPAVALPSSGVAPAAALPIARAGSSR